MHLESATLNKPNFGGQTALILPERNSGTETPDQGELKPKLSLEGTVAKRTSSRLRRTNDRSVWVISSDAEDASHVSGSYPSKQKYKLDLSSLHEDHEDDENAEIGVRQQCLNKFIFKIYSTHI